MELNCRGCGRPVVSMEQAVEAVRRDGWKYSPEEIEAIEVWHTDCALSEGRIDEADVRELEFYWEL